MRAPTSRAQVAELQSNERYHLIEGKLATAKPAWPHHTIQQRNTLRALQRAACVSPALRSSAGANAADADEAAVTPTAAPSQRGASQDGQAGRAAARGAASGSSSSGNALNGMAGGAASADAVKHGELTRRTEEDYRRQRAIFEAKYGSSIASMHIQQYGSSVAGFQPTLRRRGPKN